MGRVWYIYLHECLILMVNHVGIHIRTSPMDACYEYRKNVKLRLGNPIGFFRVSQVGDLEIRYCLGCLNEWYSNRLFNLILTRTFYRGTPRFSSIYFVFSRFVKLYHQLTADKGTAKLRQNGNGLKCLDL